MKIRQFLRFFGVVMLVSSVVAPLSVRAQGLNIVRDAEIEQDLKVMSTPIFQQAGIPPESVRFVLVNSDMVNAFVSGGMNIYITTGLIQSTKSVDELIGVIAHETGHIAGGHLVRTREAIDQATTGALVTTLAGIAAAVASGDGKAGAAAVSLGQQIGQRSFLSYSRTQESAADQAGLSYLTGSHISAQGLQSFLERLQDEELLPEDQQTAFVRTHPLTRDRVQTMANAVATQPANVGAAPADYVRRYEAMRAKLQGFLNPRGTLNKVAANSEAENDLYARAIALHQVGRTAEAVPLLDSLLLKSPNNPYYNELKGQVLYESGRVAEAVAPYRKAVELSGGHSVLRVGLAQALLAGKPSEADLLDAQTQLEKAIAGERRSMLAWRLLATVYGRQGQQAMANYALAEEAFAKGDMKLAELQAKRAQQGLPPASPGYRKAQDLLQAITEAKKDN
jgi:predicted Zn-dependent protease